LATPAHSETPDAEATHDEAAANAFRVGFGPLGD
jgi:hypothetical protein